MFAEYDISRFVGESSITPEKLELILNKFTPIEDNNEKEFFELAVSDAYKKRQELNKLKAIEELNKKEEDEIGIAELFEPSLEGQDK